MSLTFFAKTDLPRTIAGAGLSSLIGVRLLAGI